MRIGWKPATLAGLVVLCLAGASFAAARTTTPGPGHPPGPPGPPQAASCNLGGADGKVKHLIYIQFDNVHYRRRRPERRSRPGADAEPPQLPQGERDALHERPHDPDLAHRRRDPLDADRPLSRPDGADGHEQLRLLPPSEMPNFTSSFQYWTSPVSERAGDTLPNMITDGQKNTPAPWVPFTRAGCDVGGVGTANIELENNSTDVTNVYGAGSPEASGDRRCKKPTDFVGIADPLLEGSTSVCTESTHAQADSLPDEPGGYIGLQRALRREVRRSGDRAEHAPGTACPTPRRPRASPAAPTSRTPTATAASRASTGWRPEHARLRRADAGVRRAGDLRVHLGRARHPHAEHRRPTRTRARRRARARRSTSAARRVQPGVRRLLLEPRRPRDQQEQHALRGHRRRGRPLRRRHRHGPPADGSSTTRTRPAPTSPPARRTRSARSTRTSRPCFRRGEPGFDIHFDDAPAFYVNGQPARDRSRASASSSVTSAT